METRPKIDIEPTPFDLSIELIGRIFFIVLLALTAFVYFKLPDKIPTHFNFAGHPDNFGNKNVILIFPAFATIIYFGLTKINHYPYLFNYLTKITVDNAKRQYTIATRLIRFLKVFVLMVFTFLVFSIYLTALNMTRRLSIWFVPVTVGLLVLVLVIAIFKSLKQDSRQQS
ncbi:MAG: DUF1648 domain-containing protein [Sphingobacteriales bacterium]|nr:MAG: DUF1648 domain-containing protein [Sphingobacteriales bacterium]